jgi:hypothetical protein
MENNVAETDALTDAKFGGGRYLSDFPCKIRVLTRDPMVYVDQFANTRYAFAVYNTETKQVQILNKGPGFAKRFQELNDSDFGSDVRKLTIKISTNGKSGKEIRYTIDPVGQPSGLTKEETENIVENGFDLAEVIKKNNPNAIRLSEVNAGKKVVAPEEEQVEPDDTAVVTDSDMEEEINLSDIPY